MRRNSWHKEERVQRQEREGEAGCAPASRQPLPKSRVRERPPPPRAPGLPPPASPAAAYSAGEQRAGPHPPPRDLSHQRPWSHQRLRPRPSARLPSPHGASVRPVRPARPAPALRAPRAPHLPRAALCAHWTCAQTRPGAPARARAQRRAPPAHGGGRLALSFSCSAASAACCARACSSTAGSAISCVARAKRGQTKVRPWSKRVKQ